MQSQLFVFFAIALIFILLIRAIPTITATLAMVGTFLYKLACNQWDAQMGDRAIDYRVYQAIFD